MYNNNKEVVSLIERLICVNKVSKSVTGGKKLSFAVLVVVGDGKGKVGFGSGKAREVTDARNKALELAKRSMIKVPLREGRTLHYDCEGKFGKGHIIMRPAPVGTGIIAGGFMRAVFECLGIQDVVSKSLGSNNPYNVITATLEALKGMSSPKSIADRRSKHVSEIIKRRNVIIGNNLDNPADNNAHEGNLANDANLVNNNIEG
jgi:small subunit ribosomal protein S5